MTKMNHGTDRQTKIDNGNELARAHSRQVPNGGIKNIRNRWGPGLVVPPGESWPLLRVSQIGVGNLNVRVCSLLLRLPTVRPLVRLRIIGPAFGFENH